MLHRKIPILGGLALSLALLAPQLTIWASAGWAAPEYSDASTRGLAPSNQAQRSTAPKAKAVRIAQAEIDLPSDDVSPEALQSLKKELDHIRHGTVDQPEAPIFDPPLPVRRKGAPTPDLATTSPQQTQPPSKLDAETARALGSILLVAFRGSQPSDNGPKAVHSLIQSGLIAGTVFGRDNVQSRAQLKELMKFLAPSASSVHPLFAIAEIGGRSDALPPVRDFEQWPSHSDVAAKGDPEYAYSTYRSMGSTLASLGFHLNFGPILGAAAGARNPSASFGANPLQAGVFAKTFILGHREAGVIPVPVVDGGELSLRTLKTLLVSYPDIPIAAHMTNEIRPFAVYDDLVRGPRFCFVTLTQDSDSSGAAGNFNRGCDVLVLDGGTENPATVRDRVAQSVAEAIKHGELSLDALNASSQRLFALRSSLASLSDDARKRAVRSP